jgi:hypothetical protein
MLGKTLLVVVAFLAVVAVVAVIGAVINLDEQANVAAVTTETTEVTTTSAPIRCLDAAGLSDVEERDVAVWRGLHEGPAYAIVVHKLRKPANAPTVVAGTYVVTGRFKVAAEGTGLTSTEGLQADALVQEVADCLGN